MKPSWAGAAAAVLTAILAATTIVADFEAANWRYYKELDLPDPLPEQSLVFVEPDAEVFSSAQRGLQDVRILDGDGAEVAYSFEVAFGTHTQIARGAAVRDIAYSSDGRTSFAVDLTEAPAIHNAVEVGVTSDNFRREVIVEASDDGAEWSEVGRGEIYDFSTPDLGVRARDTRVTYNESTAPRLRVTIEGSEEGPVEVASASVSYRLDRAPEEVEWPATISSTLVEAEAGRTLVDIELPVRGLPTSRLEVAFAGQNFYRLVEVQASADGAAWRTLSGRAELYSLDTPKFTGERLSLGYSETADRYLRLVVFDGDDAPLKVIGVRVWGLVRRITFLGEPGAQYWLFYGHPEARLPAYDAARVLEFFDREHATVASLGPQEENPDFAIPLVPVTERMPWLLPAAVSTAAVLVGVLLLAVLRRVRAALPPPPAGDSEER